MKRSSKKANGTSLRIALIFLCIITLLIAGGVFLKLFLILKSSTFDPSHEYILEVDESSQKGALIAFLPSNKSVVLLSISGKAEGSGFGEYLNVPVDAKAHMPVSLNVSQLIQNMLTGNKNDTGMTIIDKLRLLLFVNSLRPGDFQVQNLQLPVSPTVSDKLLPSLLLDNTIYADNESVTVENATGVLGIGNKVARQLNMIGVNVVLVSTSPNVQNTTVLTTLHPSTYTSMRIARLYHAITQRAQGSGISDSTLTIGKDSLSQLQ